MSLHPAPASLPTAPEGVENGTFGRTEIRVLGIGFALATVAYLLPFVRMLFSALVTLFHELGHAVVAWTMGYPALPAFDFVYGGGFTHWGAFRPSIAWAVAAGFAWAGWSFRRNPKTLLVLGVLFGFWLFMISAEWRRELAMAGAGHLFELILAGVFFYMALSGTGWRVPEIERPLGAFVAFFVLIHSTAFALRLRNDTGFLAWYREGKGGAVMNDLESVALDLHIHLGLTPGIEGIAALLVAFSPVPIVIAAGWHRFRVGCHRFVGSLLVTR